VNGRIGRLAAALAFLSAAGTAAAQEAYPSKPVHLLVPYPAGGAVDIVGRTLGQQLSEHWHQPVVIDNRPGAGGTIASEVAAKAAPDGYTLIIVASGHAINPLLYSKLPYDTFKDFTPISELASSPNVLLVNSASPLKTLGDLLTLARQKPGELSYGMAGNGTSTHLAGELLKYLAKIDIVAIPYKGGAPVLNDLMGGQIPLSFNNIPESIGQIRAGAVRPLAVTTAARSPVLPDVPTIAEAGVPGYDTGVWWGLLGPAGLPKDIVAKLHDDVVAALNASAVKERLLGLGAVTIGSTPEQFDARIHADGKVWAPVIKAAKIHID
jgi:tripartite-type tricarboxylate transporter receptor subunit TctC